MQMLELFKDIKDNIKNSNKKIAKKIAYRSGIIPYTIKNDLIFFCLMVPSNEKFGGRFPQFPKGKIEKNTSPLENAIKEAEEEAGISRNNIIFIELFDSDEEKKIIWYLSKLKDFSLSEPHYESLYSFWAESSQCERIIRASQKLVLQKAIQRIKDIEFS